MLTRNRHQPIPNKKPAFANATAGKVVVPVRIELTSKV